MQKLKLAGCVVLYNPDAEVLENVKSYIKSIDYLYVVDNANGTELIDKLEKMYPCKIKAVKHKENMGIAYSLNEVLQLAKNDYGLLLTMDQDSRFYKNCMQIYKGELTAFDWNKTLGIGPMIVNCNFASQKSTKVAWRETTRLITSGNIISISNALKIGGFSENLFIDEVDYDLCYKGAANGLKMYTNLAGVHLLHSLGNTFTRNVLGHTFEIMNHNKVRKYYIFRNRLYIAKKYHSVMGVGDTWKYYLKSNLRLIFDVVFFENDKFNKLKYMSLGFYDFLRNCYGKRF